MPGVRGELLLGLGPVSRGCRGTGGATRSASVLLMRTFSSENNYTLVCGDLYVYLRLALSQFCAAVFPQRSPFGALLGRSQCTRGRECRERPRETLLVALLGEPR